MKHRYAAILIALFLASRPAFAADRPAPQHDYLQGYEGTSLEYILSLPDGAGPWPVLLTYDGYAAGGVEDTAYADQFVPKGYALIGVSVRGTSCSAGKFDFFEPVQALDAVKVIQWIAAPAQAAWSNGKVGMIGKSYPGITQLFAAEACADDEECSNHLVTIAPGHYYGDVYRDVAYPGGIFNYGFAALWSFVAQPSPGEQNALERIADGDSQCAVNRLDHAVNPRYNPFVQAQEHMFDDELIRERSPIYNAHKIRVPVYTANAWQDEQLGPRATYLMERLTVPYKQILGNGSHGLYRYPPNLAQLERWFDHYLKGETNGIETEKKVTVWFDSTSSTDQGWKLEFDQWPLPDSAVTPLTLHLRSGGSLDGEEPGADELPDAYAYPGGTESRSGEDVNAVGGFPTSVHKFKNDGYSIPAPPGTSLTYVTNPLPQDKVVLGTIRATFFIASTAPDTDFQVSVSEVRPNGDVEYVQKGWLRASHRKLDETASSVSIYRPVHTHQQSDLEPLTPGQVVQIDIGLPPVGHAFRAGERIRIDIEMPSLTPELWAFVPVPIPAVNLVYHDAEHPSRILLPTVPVAGPLSTEPDCGSRIRQPCRKALP